jgi:L-histidine N-alpha-methyltransferase
MQAVHPETRFELVGGSARSDRRSRMASEVRAGLSNRPRSIPPKYFYDERGSLLFDAICDLPEYYLTRAERSLLQTHSAGIVQRSGARCLVEIGSGMARKTGSLLRAICARTLSPLYVPFDIAPGPIRESARGLLAAHPTLRVRGIVGDFAHECLRLSRGLSASDGPTLFAFLGSTIGNLDEAEAPALLRTIASLMKSGDRFLLGIDLVKDPRTIALAYNDAQGVTAAFNKNVLSVLARELDGDIDENAFEHLALYDETRARVEMYLVSQRPQTLTLSSGDMHIELARGERVMTEISRKFTQESATQMLVEGGMVMREWLSTPERLFALCVAERGS